MWPGLRLALLRAGTFYLIRMHFEADCAVDPPLSWTYEEGICSRADANADTEQLRITICCALFVTAVTFLAGSSRDITFTSTS
ncbi:hypothetical protein BV25DRAFT_1819046 [Artomyces pyxidatus]|uniref:Uncharacterized protein n=1 Tax=Artomyces pyxidatus TaxID=48021 RepID=A0ACB8TGY2_9AGAM|nr:hypothetical protein BV25DRAFT_1819046 [Artomyces pyxidatus]